MEDQQEEMEGSPERGLADSFRSIMNKLYLGDSIYAEDYGVHIVLTTENGMGASNKIYLEDGIMHLLFQYWEQQRKIEAIDE